MKAFFRVSFLFLSSKSKSYYLSLCFLTVLYFLFISLLLINGNYFKDAWGVAINNYENFSKNNKEFEYLKFFALEKINSDRTKFGLNPVLLSNNTAAQIQANESLKTETISHWDVNGLKPYMLYSFYNGSGYVQQNIAQVSYTYSKKSNLKSSEICNSAEQSICKPIDPLKAISSLENSMMYNDVICCNNGHKNNVLNKFHTHVSIGIAFNKYYFVMVQNFENQYFDKNYKVEKSTDNIINVKAKILNDSNKTIDNNFTINHIAFYLDDKPTKIQYEKNKDRNSYDFGDLKLMVSKPLKSDKVYQQQSDTYRIIEAKKWVVQKNNIDLEIKIPNTINKKDKLLTMVVYAKDNTEKNYDNDKKAIVSNDNSKVNEFIPLSAHTFFNY